MKRLILATLLAGTAIAPALAQEHEHRHAGTHVHGLAELAVALNPDGTLVAEIESPLYNLIGFERAPRDEGEYALVGQAIAALESDARPAFNAEAGCSLTETQLEGFPPASAHGHHDDDHEHEHMDHDGEEPHGHGHDDHGHDRDEADHDHDHTHDHYGDHSEAETPPQDHAHDHGHSHGHSHGEGERRYSDGFVTWTFTCTSPERLTRIDAGSLFAGFDRLERVSIQFFDGTRSAAETLTPSSSTLSIR
ncbi:MAG: ZrgA family zinc uptake protein [Glycocaulis sp.]